MVRQKGATVNVPSIAPTMPSRSTLEVQTTEEGAGLSDMYQVLAESGELQCTRTSPSARLRGRRGRSSLKTLARAPRARRIMSLPVIVGVELYAEAIPAIRSSPPDPVRRETAEASVRTSSLNVEGQETPTLTQTRVAARGRSRARGRITRKQKPTNADVTVATLIGMEEDGQPNGREWTVQSPATLNERAACTLNVHVDEDILEGFFTPV